MEKKPEFAVVVSPGVLSHMKPVGESGWTPQRDRQAGRRAGREEGGREG